MDTITVKLFASLAKFKPAQTTEASFKVTITPGATVEQLIRELGLPPDKINTISVNEEIVKTNYHLRDGDAVTFFPTIAGG